MFGISYDPLYLGTYLLTAGGLKVTGALVRTRPFDQRRTHVHDPSRFIDTHLSRRADDSIAMQVSTRLIFCCRIFSSCSVI